MPQPSKTLVESSRCPLSVLCTAANFPATMLPLHASLTASRQFLASMGRRYLGCYTGNMRHNLIPNARPSEMVQQNLFILYSKHIVVHDRNRLCNFGNLQHALRQNLISMHLQSMPIHVKPSQNKKGRNFF